MTLLDYVEYANLWPHEPDLQGLFYYLLDLGADINAAPTNSTHQFPLFYRLFRRISNNFKASFHFKLLDWPTRVGSQKNYQKSYLDGTYNEYQQVNEVKLQISQNLPRLNSLQQYHGKNGNISYDFCRNGQSFYKDFMFKVRWYRLYGSPRVKAYHCKVFRINFFKMSQKLWELLSKSRITGN